MFYCEVANEDKVIQDDGDKGSFIDISIEGQSQATSAATIVIFRCYLVIGKLVDTEIEGD